MLRPLAVLAVCGLIVALLAYGRPDPDAFVCADTARGGEAVLGTVMGAIPIYRTAAPGDCLRYERRPN